MVDGSKYRMPHARVWQSAASVFAALSLTWAVLITMNMLIEDPAVFHCGSSPCSLVDVASLFARNASVVAWLMFPYFLAAWALKCGARRISRTAPSWLRFHPRMMPAAGAIFIALLVFGQIGAALGTYMMLEHNPQNAYCAYAGSAVEANYYGYGPCRIGLGELTLLFAQNVYVVGVLLLPFALLGWLVVRLVASPERGNDR